MSKVVTSRISEEAYTAFMMIAAETGDHSSKLIQKMIDKFIVERGAEYRNIHEVAVYQAYLKERDRQSFIDQIKRLISYYQTWPTPQDDWQLLRDACAGIGVDFEKLKGE